jgi:hypothetical protein
VPQILYYKFNEGAGATAQNSASTSVAPPFGTFVGSGGFGAGASGLGLANFGSGMTGTGGAGSPNYLQTGYTMNLQNASWTVEFWYSIGVAGTLQIVAGVQGVGELRITSAGAQGSSLTLWATSLNMAMLIGVVPPPGTWIHVAFVFDASQPLAVITPYYNGQPWNSVVQFATSVVPIGQFYVSNPSGYGINGGIDEFRLWSVARTPSEIAAYYNVEIPTENILVASNSGLGIGDFFLSLSILPPGATQGFTLLSGATRGLVGFGPVFGIMPDATTFQGISSPLAVGNPFHFPVGPQSVYPGAPLIVPPGTFASLAGQSFDFVAVLFDPSFTLLAQSNVVRMRW